MKQKVVIVGGVAGGAGTAARLRRLDETAEIVLFERGDYISFANCGLPYYIGDVIRERENLLVMKAELMAGRFRVDVRVKSEVIAINRTRKTVTVRGGTGEVYEESYDKLVLSTGSAPVIPEIPGIADPNVFTLWNMGDVDRIKAFVTREKPRRAVVVGAGFIGLEMAENLREIGLEVSLVAKYNQVMPKVDYELGQILNKTLRSHGVSLCLEEKLTECRREESGLQAVLASGNCLDTDMIVLAIGVRPNSKLAEEAGLALNARKGVVVDEHLKTSDDNIYALGDVVEVRHFVSGKPVMIPLAGPANKQGRICGDNLAGIPSTYPGSLGSSVAKVFDMTVATTGLVEKQLKEMGMQPSKDYFVAKTHAFSHATYYPDAKQMALKVLYLPDGTIVGAEAVGAEGVDKRMDVIATAIHFKGTVYDLKELDLCYAPPYSSAKDPVNMIGFMAENNLSGRCQYITWDEYKAMDKSDVILLDVRETEEVALGVIENAVHIPLNSLRENLDQLDRTKKIVVCCAIGLRAYVACRILIQNGFHAIDLSGGYTTYSQWMLP